jgi:sortase A
VRETGLALITLGVVVLLFVGYQLFGTNITEAHNQSSLAKQFDSTISSTTPPTTTDSPTVSSPPTTAAALPSVPAGDALDHLVIPKLHLDKFVVEGTSEDALRKGPGHYEGTAYPGQIGNAAIAGHRTTYGAPFFDLDHLSKGDPIYITDLKHRTWLYRVSAPPEVVSPVDVSVLDPTSFAQLTLTTCNPRFSATSRLVVFARLIGKAEPATPARTPVTTPGTLPSDNTPKNLGGGRSSAWLPALGYGGLVILLWIGTRLWINRSRRWHRFGAYVVGIAICLVPLWFCFENAVLLMPQSI